MLEVVRVASFSAACFSQVLEFLWDFIFSTSSDDVLRVPTTSAALLLPPPNSLLSPAFSLKTSNDSCEEQNNSQPGDYLNLLEKNRKRNLSSSLARCAASRVVNLRRSSFRSVAFSARSKKIKNNNGDNWKNTESDLVHQKILESQSHVVDVLHRCIETGWNRVVCR
jgi:hypothetical protein